ncbi:MAG TPA: hypothetical protein VFV34_01425 [Blastocatellia bacterium]|nr:hypothetical protein [Blastocatellia bacterium]
MKRKRDQGEAAATPFVQRCRRMLPKSVVTNGVETQVSLTVDLSAVREEQDK